VTPSTPNCVGIEMKSPVLRLEDVTTSFHLRQGWFPAVLGVSFALFPDETLALVGESGSGKSVTVLTVMRLLPEPGSRVESGRVFYKETDLLQLSEAEMRALRGSKLAMIFQEPMTSLNPIMPVGRQVAEALVYHQGIGWREADVEVLGLLEQVKIPAAKSRARDYPHQLSGGMRQRVMIAMSLACKPDVLLADEPTTALDVTIQAQVLSLLFDLRASHRMGMIFITHDLAVVAQVADRVGVMYAGQIVELASTKDLFTSPGHPYSQALLSSLPRLDRDGQQLKSIPGLVPSLNLMPQGCRFAPRCPAKMDICQQERPELRILGSSGATGHLVRCWLGEGG